MIWFQITITCRTNDIEKHARPLTPKIVTYISRVWKNYGHLASWLFIFFKFSFAVVFVYNWYDSSALFSSYSILVVALFVSACVQWAQIFFQSELMSNLMEYIYTTPELKPIVIFRDVLRILRLKAYQDIRCIAERNKDCSNTKGNSNKIFIIDQIIVNDGDNEDETDR